MRATRYFSRLMLIAAAAMMLGSCKVDNNVPFHLSGYGYAYVIQTQSDGTNFFTPVVGFQTSSSTSVMESGQVLRGSTYLDGNVYFNSLFETPFPPANRELDITDLNGRYNLSATDDKGITATGYIDLSFTAGNDMNLGAGVTELDVTDFTYSDGTATATIGEVTNATAYLFFVVPVYEGGPVYNANIKTLLLHSTVGITGKTAGPQIITATIRSSSNDLWVYPAAWKSTSTGTVVIFGQGKLLPKGATNFQ